MQPRHSSILRENALLSLNRDIIVFKLTEHLALLQTLSLRAPIL